MYYIIIFSKALFNLFSKNVTKSTEFYRSMPTFTYFGPGKKVQEHKKLPTFHTILSPHTISSFSFFTPHRNLTPFILGPRVCEKMYSDPFITFFPQQVPPNKPHSPPFGVSFLGWMGEEYFHHITLHLVLSA